MQASGIILCGGLGQRAGGADKGLLPWQGRTRAEAVIARLAPQLDDIVISANRNLDRYREFGLPVVTDTMAGYQGPLAGIASSLPHCARDIVVVVPCDTPQIPEDLVLRLLDPLADSAIDLSVAHDGERPQYLFCALRKHTAESLQRYLESGARSVHGWQRSLNNVIVDFSDRADAFLNLNSDAPAEE